MSDALFELPDDRPAPLPSPAKKRPDEYEQLEGRALALLRAEVARSNIKMAAIRLGFSRPAISMALAGKYPAGVGRLRAKIFETFADRVDCPHLGHDIAPSECRDHRDAPMPTAPRRAVAHWQACRNCLFNPNITSHATERANG